MSTAKTTLTSGLPIDALVDLRAPGGVIRCTLFDAAATAVALSADELPCSILRNGAELYSYNGAVVSGDPRLAAVIGRAVKLCRAERIESAAQSCGGEVRH